MSKSHNKKRNIGIIYELLLKEIASNVLENKNKKSTVALNLIRKYFVDGTEVYKEFRLMNSLAKTKITNENVIGSILIESKLASRRIDQRKLEIEKSNLLRDINIHFGLDFFDKHLAEYKTYATLQILFNNWRSQTPDIGTTAKLEQKLCEEILREEPIISETTSDNSERINSLEPGMKRLVLKLMTKKLKEKYDGILNNDQKQLMKEYVFNYLSGKNKENIKARLSHIKNNTIDLIEKYINKKTSGDYLNGKLIACKNVLLKESLDNISDETITKFLGLIKLQQELSSEE